MHPKTDLALLAESLAQLSKTPYFNRAIEKHAQALIDVIRHVLSVSPPYDDEILRAFADKVWTCHRYLQGSTTKEAPYEIEYCMRHAITDWLQDPCLVTTALTDEKDFHLKPGDPWEFVAATLDRYGGIVPEEKLIFIGVPRIYKHMPLFCAALYHELGHFVDLTRNVTDTTLLLNPAPEDLIEIVRNHRREHFADLFAACYVGSAIVDSLDATNPLAPRTFTHPPTAERIDFINGFLKGESLEDINMFQDALLKLGLPPLQQRFKVPSIESAFDDIRPHVLQEPAELHGIMAAGWSYLGKIKSGAGPIWTASGNSLEVIRIVNDLTEKSIRNDSIRHLWFGGIK